MALMAEELACLIVARNLGDAVIHARFLERLQARGYARRYLVWTRPQTAFLFSGFPDCEVVTSPFPLGSMKEWTVRAGLDLLKGAREIRHRSPSVTLDLIGDFRERCLARLAGSRRHLHLGWHPQHPFNRLIRNPLGPGRPCLVIPPDVLNVYVAHDRLARHLTPEAGPLLDEPVRWAGEGRRIGFHPFASQPCREWPFQRWVELADILIEAGFKIRAFAAPGERKVLEDLFSGHDVEIVTGNLPSFIMAVSELDAMVGLDSFSVHVAHRAGLPSVMISGANDHRLFCPPSAVAIAHDGGCIFHPCYNRPRCEGKSFEYACIKAASVAETADAVRSFWR